MPKTSTPKNVLSQEQAWTGTFDHFPKSLRMVSLSLQPNETLGCADNTNTHDGKRKDISVHDGASSRIFSSIWTALLTPPSCQSLVHMLLLERYILRCAAPPYSDPASTG